MPYINGQFIFPLIVIAAIVCFCWQTEGYFREALNFDFSANDDYKKGMASFMDLATPKISIITFWAICILLSIVTFIKKYSLIPLMGVSTCLYLLTGMSKSNWAWFLGWLALGLVFYFMYGYKHSKLAKKEK